MAAKVQSLIAAAGDAAGLAEVQAGGGAHLSKLWEFRWIGLVGLVGFHGVEDLARGPYVSSHQSFV